MARQAAAHLLPYGVMCCSSMLLKMHHALSNLDNGDPKPDFDKSQ